MTYLPAQPILDRVDARGGVGRIFGVDAHGDRLGHDAHHGRPGARLYSDPEVRRWQQAVLRMRRTGKVTIDMADRFCIGVLGVNPALVYGRAFFEDEMAV